MYHKLYKFVKKVVSCEGQKQFKGGADGYL